MEKEFNIKTLFDKKNISVSIFDVLLLHHKVITNTGYNMDAIFL